MKKYIFLILISVFIFACDSDDSSKSDENLNANTHKITVKEILQTSNYTYLSGDDIWIAVTRMNANKGDVFYYDGGMLMENFNSKELNKTFEKIWFVDNIRTDPEIVQTDMSSDLSQHNMKPTIEKNSVELSFPEDVTSIADVYANKDALAGKKIKVKGIVSKVNSQIMNRNWIHIQDGTEHNGDYDLTVTSLTEVQKGDTIVAEGTVSLDKDFGYGYEYKVILEDAFIK